MVAVNCGGRGRDGVLGVVWLRCGMWLCYCVGITSYCLAWYMCAVWCGVVYGCGVLRVLHWTVLCGVCVWCGVMWYKIVVFCRALHWTALRGVCVWRGSLR